MRRLVLLACLAAFGLAACGEEQGDVDASNPFVTFRGAMAALHDGDWTTLQRYLSKDARFALEKDLRRLQKNLAEPRPNSQLMEIVKLQLGEGYEAEVERAVNGGMPELMRFFVAFSPREKDPPLGPPVLDPKRGVATLTYSLSSGEQRTVALEQHAGRWVITNLQL